MWYIQGLHSYYLKEHPNKLPADQADKVIPLQRSPYFLH